MINMAMQSALLTILASGVHVETIEENRFKISAIVKNGGSVSESFAAQVAIIKKAQQMCKALKRGSAVSEGTLYLDDLPPPEGKKKGLKQVSEFYSCAAKSQR